MTKTIWFILLLGLVAACSAYGSTNFKVWKAYSIAGTEYTGMTETTAKGIAADCASVGMEYREHWATKTHLDAAWCQPREPWAKPVHGLWTPLDHTMLIGLTYNCLYEAYKGGRLGMSEWVGGQFDVLDYAAFSVPAFDVKPSKVECRD